MFFFEKVVKDLVKEWKILSPRASDQEDVETYFKYFFEFHFSMKFEILVGQLLFRQVQVQLSSGSSVET